MRAAPVRVAKDATIVAMGADGAMRTLRQGMNGFTCTCNRRRAWSEETCGIT